MANVRCLVCGHFHGGQGNCITAHALVSPEDCATCVQAAKTAIPADAMRPVPVRNREGLTWEEWRNAANLGRKEPVETIAGYTAWQAGEDPTEYAGQK